MMMTIWILSMSKAIVIPWEFWRFYFRRGKGWGKDRVYKFELSAVY